MKNKLGKNVVKFVQDCSNSRRESFGWYAYDATYDKGKTLPYYSINIETIRTESHIGGMKTLLFEQYKVNRSKSQTV